MKLYLTTILLLATSIAFAASQVRKVGEADEIPKNGFADFAELKKWASSSSFGGGRAVKFKIGGRDVFYSDRMLTSGKVTSELIFFTQSHDGRIRSFLAVPAQHKEHKITVEPDWVIVRCYNSSKKGWQVVLKFSPWMLPDAIDKPNKREQGGAHQPTARPESASE